MALRTFSSLPSSPFRISARVTADGVDIGAIVIARADALETVTASDVTCHVLCDSVTVTASATDAHGTKVKTSAFTIEPATVTNWWDSLSCAQKSDAVAVRPKGNERAVGPDYCRTYASLVPGAKTVVDRTFGERYGVGRDYFDATSAFEITSSGKEVIEDKIRLSAKDNAPLGRYLLLAEAQAGGVTKSGLATVTIAPRPAQDDMGPLFTQASVTATKLRVTFNKELDTGSAPAGSAFRVTATRYGTVRTINGTGTVALAARPNLRDISVTLASGVRHGETVTVTYTRPSQNPLQDRDRNTVRSFSNRPVTNPTPMTPTFSNGHVWLAGNGVTLEFSGDLDLGSVPAGSAFVVRAAKYDTARTLNGTGTVRISNNTVRVNLNGTVRHGEKVTVNYTVPSQNPLQDRVGNEVESFTNGRLSNNIRPDTSDQTGPTFASAEVSKTTLKVTFNEHLDPKSQTAGSAFEVRATRSGSTRTIAGIGTVKTSRFGQNPISRQHVRVPNDFAEVTLESSVFRGETVTVSYTKPDDDPLKDDSYRRNDVLNFTGQSVTNNTPLPTPIRTDISITGSGPFPTVDYGKVIITFDQAMDATSRPAASAFTVTSKLPPRRSVLTGKLYDFDRVKTHTVTGTPTISGSNVTLNLDSVIGGAFQVRYNKPTSPSAS